MAFIHGVHSWRSSEPVRLVRLVRHFFGLPWYFLTRVFNLSFSFSLFYYKSRKVTYRTYHPLWSITCITLLKCTMTYRRTTFLNVTWIHALTPRLIATIHNNTKNNTNSSLFHRHNSTPQMNTMNHRHSLPPQSISTSFEYCQYSPIFHQ